MHLKKFITALLSIGLSVAMAPSAFAKDFKDTTKHWAKTYISTMSDQNIITGYDDGTFKPDSTITNAEFLTMLVKSYNTLSSDYGMPSTTVPHEWHYPYITKATQKGFITIHQYDGKENKNMTRADMALAISNALSATPTPTDTNAILQRFTDYKAISELQQPYREAIAKVASVSIITGDQNKNFNPKNTATRAEAATMLTKFMTYYPTQPTTLPADDKGKIYDFDVTKVSESDVVAAITKQVVLMPGDTDMKWTIAEANAKYTAYDEKIVGKDVLFAQAKGFAEALYNVNYQTVDANEWWGKIYPYFDNDWRSGTSNLTGRQYTDRLITLAKDQKINMTAVFVADESCVYTLSDKVAYLNTAGKQTEKDYTPWAVRGTLYYKFNEQPLTGTAGARFWKPLVSSGIEQAGKWYKVDYELRFGVGLKKTAQTHFSKEFILGTATEVK